MNNLREIVKRHIVSETRQELTGFSESEQDRVFEIFNSEGTIDRKVDEVLDAFRNELEKDSPKAKKRKKDNFVYASLNIILTIGIAYGVNMELWVMVGIVAIANIFIHGYFTFWSE